MREPEETYAYSLEEVLAMMAALPEPTATMVASIAFTGVRRGELRGFKWENYRDGHLAVKESNWNGHVTDPKSKRSIPIIQHLAARFVALREGQGNPISGPIFPNANGKAADPNNGLNRIILPVLEACEHCGKPEDAHRHATVHHNYQRNSSLPEWHGWHAFRRGAATNLHRLGVDDYTIAQILGHEDVAVTRDCYIKDDNKEAVTAMEKYQQQLESIMANNWPPKAKVQPIKGVM